MKKILIILILIGFSFSLFSSHILPNSEAETFNVEPGDKNSTPFECINPMSETAKIWLVFSGTAGSWFSPNPLQCGILGSLKTVSPTMTYQIPSYADGIYTVSVNLKCESWPDNNRPCEIPQSAGYDFNIKVSSTQSSIQYGGYSSWDAYCKGEYGSGYVYHAFPVGCTLEETTIDPSTGPHIVMIYEEYFPSIPKIFPSFAYVNDDFGVWNKFALIPPTGWQIDGYSDYETDPDVLIVEAFSKISDQNQIVFIKIIETDFGTTTSEDIKRFRVLTDGELREEVFSAFFDEFEYTNISVKIYDDVFTQQFSYFDDGDLVTEFEVFANGIAINLTFFNTEKSDMTKIIDSLFVGSMISKSALYDSDYQNTQPVKEDKPTVILKTNLGKITIEFFQNDAPNHVRNFITLTQSGFYDGTVFHRIIPGFMIQGGDPNTVDGDQRTWGVGGPSTSVDAEFNSIKHERGIVSMARSADPNSAGSQFFIVHADSDFLNGEYTVFGKIMGEESFNTLDKIAAVETKNGDIPLNPEQVKIIKAEVVLVKNTSEITDFKLQPKQDNGGGCLIATATYGSELAPQVQLLRELRDNSLLQTESGTRFINIFNDFYYSFSPYIADYERENPAFKEMVKMTITPMITSLSILNYVDMNSENLVVGYGISLILLNLGMYVGIPVIAIVGIKKKF